MALGKKDKKTLPDAAALRAMSATELEAMYAADKEELMRARFQHATASLEDTAFLKTMRRQIARVATILTEKRENS